MDAKEDNVAIKDPNYLRCYPRVYKVGTKSRQNSVLDAQLSQ